MDFFDDPEIVNGHDNFTRPNFGAGLMLLNSNFFVGLSVPRILNVSITDGSTQSERYKRHYYLTAGVTAEIQRTPVKATTLIRSMAGEAYSFDITMSALLEDVMWAGVSVRDLKHFGLLGIIQVGDNLQLGYSFELPTNNLIYGNYGTHEVSVSYTIRYGYGRQEPIFFLSFRAKLCFTICNDLVLRLHGKAYYHTRRQSLTDCRKTNGMAVQGDETGDGTLTGWATEYIRRKYKKPEMFFVSHATDWIVL